MPIAQSEHADNLDDLLSESDADSRDLAVVENRASWAVNARITSSLLTYATPSQERTVERYPSIDEVGSHDERLRTDQDKDDTQGSKSSLRKRGTRTVELECVDGSTHHVRVGWRTTLHGLRKMCKISNEDIAIWEQDKIVHSEHDMDAFRKRLWAGEHTRRVKLYRFVNDPDEENTEVYFNGKMNGSTRG